MRHQVADPEDVGPDAREGRDDSLSLGAACCIQTQILTSSSTLQDLGIRDLSRRPPHHALTPFPCALRQTASPAVAPYSWAKCASDAALDLRLDNGTLQNLSLSAAFSGDIPAIPARLLGFSARLRSGRDQRRSELQPGPQWPPVHGRLRPIWAGATIDLSPLPYYKPVGQPTMAAGPPQLQPEPTGLRIDSFKVDGPALHLMGRVDMTADGDST